MQTTSDDEAARQCAFRFLGNLFVNVRSIDRIVEYWLRNWLAVTLRRGLIEPRHSDAIDLACYLIERVYQGVDDIVLVGQGNLALSNDSTVPQHVHYINFVAPTGGDFSLALPVRHFYCAETRALPVSLLPLLLQSEAVWKSMTRAATLGEHHCSHFHAGDDTHEWRTLFSPLAFGLEVAARMLIGLRDATPAEWYYSEDGGQRFALALVAALGRPRSSSVHAAAEAAIVGGLNADFQTTFAKPRTGVTQRMGFAVTRLLAARHAIRKQVNAVYLEMSASLQMRFCLDDSTLLPWAD
jgi:hypothetical protein